MAQSANNFNIEQQDSLHNSLRNLLISLKINTVEQFFLREKTEIKKEIHQIHVNILASDVDGRLATSIWPMLSSIAAVASSISSRSSGLFSPMNPKPIKRCMSSSKNSSTTSPVIHQRIGWPRQFFHSPSSLLPTQTRIEGPNAQGCSRFSRAFHQQHHYDPDLLMEPLEPFIDIKLKETVTDTSEKPMLKWLTSLVEHCSTWSNNRTNCQPPRTWRSCPDANLEGAVAQRKMDGAIMLRTSEIKDAALCLAKHVYEVFGSQHTRRYVIGFTLCGTSMRLWQFDRSGAIGSESIDIRETKENLNKFVALILLFLTATNEVLGFDPTFVEIGDQASANTPTPQKILINTEPYPQELIIDYNIFRASGICGRGTTCWQAHLSGDRRQKFLVKDSWQPRHHKEEGDMLRDVTVQNIPHLARYHHHEDVYVANQLVDIEPHVRGGINYRSGQKFQSSDVSADSQEPTDFTDRVHRRLILKDVGKPIWTADSPVRLLEAIEGCIKGHWALLRAGYLHRDISINNLMIDNQTKDPDRKSFLIDLDMAIPYPLPNNEDHHERAGTKKRARPPGYDWNEHEPKALAAMKAGYLHYPKDLTDDFTPQYKSQPLIDCVHEFANIMRRPFVREAQPADLYAEIIGVLQQAQEKIKLSQS
ncbi:hypothetical protein PSTT_09708 [Puccinia striiformis]|uniref:Fungal-type protein kinase domain-containing protein n=1 Tax=Puccinia striiformis TaxID=27350 RepID=A0A2S4V7F0_9BASI|nr:hypothetical protein PSTT_09708 [Puccinia striiformis]